MRYIEVGTAGSVTLNLDFILPLTSGNKSNRFYSLSYHKCSRRIRRGQLSAKKCVYKAVKVTFLLLFAVVRITIII